MPVPSRNVLILCASGYGMAEPWDTRTPPLLDGAENRPRFDIARDGIADYLRSVARELDDQTGVGGGALTPWRFNVGLFDVHLRLFWSQDPLCEIAAPGEIQRLEAAIRWLQEPDRTAAGDTNLVEALEHAFHLAGPGQAQASFELQPDTVLIVTDHHVPTGGAFRYAPGQGTPAQRQACWDDLAALLGFRRHHRPVRFLGICIGTRTRDSGRLQAILGAEAWQQYAPGSH
jgi:hypothetical protein